MRDRLIEEFELGTFIDPKYNEVNATYNDFVVASFFHSHCRIDECNVCKNLHLRVTANGFLKQCLFSSKNDICIKNGNLEVGTEEDKEAYVQMKNFVEYADMTV